VNCPKSAEQDQEKRSRYLFVLLSITVPSVIVGVEVTGSSSFGVSATGCGSLPAELLPWVSFAHIRLPPLMVHS
jgi:hypothetical protein